MADKKVVLWDNLPHNNQVGHGREGLVLRLDDADCIKIYSPRRAYIAEKEFENYLCLRKAGFLVPEPRELVEVYIGKGRRVKLPDTDELVGIGLYNFDDVESVPGIVKEFFPGIPYGKKRPSIREIVRLLDYLNNLHDIGFTFDDGIAPDFIATGKRTALVDCSCLLTRDECERKYYGGFEAKSSHYKYHLLRDFLYELKINGLYFGVGLKLKIAGLVTMTNRE